MKKIILLLIVFLIPLLLMAQAAGGAISRPSVPSKQKVIKRQGNTSKTKEVVPNKNITTRGKISGADQTNSESHSAAITQKNKLPVKKKEIPPIIQKLIDNMVFVEGGSFTMGATMEQGRYAEYIENTTHTVHLSAFAICKYEVTQEEWEAVMGNNPSKNKGAKCPVEYVSWNDCYTFINKLNEMTGMKFRLPTEAEWEYAARGGNKSKTYKYAGGNGLGNVAWYENNSWERTHEVGKLTPNELGLYDMSGNVNEWCNDGYGSYSSTSVTNPVGPSNSMSRVYRGGSWRDNSTLCLVSYRNCAFPNTLAVNIGFRLAL